MSESDIIAGISYGPLAALAGVWTGDKGVDISPEPDGQEDNPYYETISFEPIGTVNNAERQELVALRYHQLVSRKSNDEVFHNESGYWMWDAEQNIVMQVLTIPRGVSLVAGGTADHSEIEVCAATDDPDWGIVQSPFMRDNAKTLEFRHRISVTGDTLIYDETTVLGIYGKRFDHSDANTLLRSSGSTSK